MSLNAAAEPGPMSNPFAPSGSRVPNVANAAVGVDADDVVGQVDRLAATSSSRAHVST